MAFLDSTFELVSEADPTKSEMRDLSALASGERLILTPRRMSAGLYGNGADGIITIAANLTLIRDLYYDTLTVAAGFTLIQGPFRIFAKNAIYNYGIITSSGAPGANASGATPGAGGVRTRGTLGQSQNDRFGGTSGATGTTGVGTTAINPSSLAYAGGGGGDGGKGGDGAAGVGGAIGTRTNLYPWPKGGGLDFEMSATDTVNTPGQATRVGGGLGGRGGSSGAGDGGANKGGHGGGAGAGGAVALTCARQIYNYGVWSNDGGAGGNGGNANGGISGGGGAGGGGGGGHSLFVFETFVGNVPTVSGGAPGTGGAPTTSGGPGMIGTAGLAGRLVRFCTLNGVFS